ncbi:MAG: SLBB domain-containing protein [Thermodesulfobacteriota bacterium]
MNARILGSGKPILPVLFLLCILLTPASVPAQTGQKLPFNGTPMDPATRQKEAENKDFETKITAFKAASYADKLRIFNALSDAEKSEWLRRYPGLELFLAGKEEKTPAVQPEKRPETRKETPGATEIESMMSGRFPKDISRELRQFGYDFFRKDISTFTPVEGVPAGPDYIVGPGDSFTIHLWGKVEATYNVTVKRDGTIAVPRLGAFNVNGLTVEQLGAELLKRFHEYYTDFEMSIAMGSLRTVDVFVVGEANNPGTYAVSSLSTIITALYAAGGPSKNGSLRDVRLFRNGTMVKSLDLYEFLIKGNKVDDVRVQSGDTLFIPVLGPVVGVAGLVKRPAVYEMKGGRTIGEVVELAGGILPVSHLQNIVVERVQDHQRRVIRSFNLDPAHEKTNENLKMALQDGDVVKVYPVHQRIRQVVYLEGHVKYPREYELKPGMALRDLIPSYEELLPEPYLSQAEIVRLVPPDLHPEIVEFDLAALLRGDPGQNLSLQDMDRVIVYDTWEKREKPVVTIKGAVRKPGTFTLYRDMTVKDLIFMAGNLTDRAYPAEATLTRIAAGEKGTDSVRISFSPGNVMTGAKQENIRLQKDDVVYIREIPNYTQTLERKAVLEGEFVFPGEYTFKEGERLDSLIERAGGLTPDAYPFGAIFQRESVKKVQDEQLRGYIDKLEEDVLTLSAQSADTALDKEQAAVLKESLISKKQLIEKLKASRSTGRMVINLEEVLVLASSEYNFEMRPGDRLIVNKKPDSVNVLGEVFNPTALVYQKGKTVGYYLDMVGGPTDNAETGQIYVVKANGSVFSKAQGKFFGMASWDVKQHRWTMAGFDSTELDPGDTVIVPKKVEKYGWLKIVKDVTQIMYQIAVAAGVIIVAF